MANLNWSNVGVSFNDTNTAMGNALKGISSAGTIFGELRKQILDEEQKAIENAYKEKVFDENMRQFGLKHGLDVERFGETQRHNTATEEMNKLRWQAELERDKNANIRDMARLELDRTRNEIEQGKLQLQLDDAAYKQRQRQLKEHVSSLVPTFMSSDAVTREAMIKREEDIINNPQSTPEARDMAIRNRKAYETLTKSMGKGEVTPLSVQQTMADIQTLFGIEGASDKAAELQLKGIDKQISLDKMAREKEDKAHDRLNEVFKDYEIGDEGRMEINTIVDAFKRVYPKIDEGRVAEEILNNVRLSNEWTSKKKKLVRSKLDPRKIDVDFVRAAIEEGIQNGRLMLDRKPASLSNEPLTPKEKEEEDEKKKAERALRDEYRKYKGILSPVSNITYGS